MGFRLGLAGWAALAIITAGPAWAESDTVCARLLRSTAEAAPARNWIALEHRSDQTLTQCGPYLAQSGLTGEVYRWLITAELNQGKLTEATASVERCLAGDAAEPACHVMQGSVLELENRPADARQAYQAALALGAGTDNPALIAQLTARITELEHRAGPPATAARSSPVPPPPARSPHTGGTMSGTGFFVNKAGYLLTNAHVVAGCRSASSVGGEPLSIIARNETADLAILKQGHAAENAVAFGPVPQIGDGVVAFGFPLPGVLSSGGNVSEGIVSAATGLGNDPTRWQISAPLQPGNSGGPVFDRSGNVIGVAVAKLDAMRVAKATGDIPQNVNFAIKATEAMALLDANAVEYSHGQSGTELKTSALAVFGKNVTVQILCAP